MLGMSNPFLAAAPRERAAAFLWTTPVKDDSAFGTSALCLLLASGCLVAFVAVIGIFLVVPSIILRDTVHLVLRIVRRGADRPVPAMRAPVR